jgi:cytochrome b561
MALGNTPTSYGAAARLLHWLTALLIFIAFPLGLLANRADLADAAAVERAYTLFSLHKTVGMMALTIGILRIVWSLTQTRPVPLHPERRLETGLATSAHWTLTIALIVVPISGWVAHAAEPGLAPILGPFPQTLEVVPEDPALARLAGSVHWVATKFLAIAILLHVAGALKHARVDRDETLARMWRGTEAGTRSPKRMIWPPVAAVALWLTAIAAGAALTPAPPSPPLDWTTTQSRILLVRASDGGEIGEVAAADITLRLSSDGTGSLDIFAALDSVTSPDADAFLNTLVIPIMQYSGAISGTPPDLTATGSLDLGGQAAPTTIAISQGADTATLGATIPLPGVPDFGLSVQATFTRP